MSYLLHNFVAGQKLTAQALNEMDTQIAANYRGVEQFDVQMVAGEIGKLSLVNDGQYLVLYYDGVEIAQTAIADVSGLIPCEALTLTSDASITLDSGNTATVTCTKSPSDSNHLLRFLSQDTAVAQVDSTGQVLGIRCGKTQVRALCGAQSQTVAVTVYEKPQPTWTSGNYFSWGTDTANSPGLIQLQENASRAIVMPYTDRTALSLKKGQTLTVTLASSDFFIQQVFVIAPLEGGFQYGLTWSDKLICANAQKLAEPAVGGNGVGLSYTAGSDCYVCLSVAKSTGGDFTDEELAALTTGGSVVFQVAPEA